MRLRDCFYLFGVIIALAGCSSATSSHVSSSQISTIAGASQAGNTNGMGALARFNNPANVAVDHTGNIYVADFDNDLVRKIDTAGVVSTVFSNANFARPFGITTAANGDLFVQTDANDTGQRDGTTGTIWHIDPTAKTGAVLVRNVGRPRGLTTLNDGRLVLADIVHHTLRLLDPMTGNITPLAGTADSAGFLNGTGAAARFNRPYGVTLERNGDILVADANNGAIRRVTLSGVVTTVAGTGTPGYKEGLASQAQFQTPQDVAVDIRGNIYVADDGNFRIRRIDLLGNVSTIAGDGTQGYRDGAGTATRFFGMEGMDITPDGSSLIIADGNSGTGALFNRIRRLTLP